MRRDFVVDLLPNPPQYESPKHHLRCPPTFLGLLCDTDCAIDSPMLVTLHRKEDGLNCSWDNTIGTGLSPLTQLLEVQNGLCFPFHFLQNPFKLLQNQPGMDSISTFSATITRPSLSKVALLTSFSDFCSNHPTRNNLPKWRLPKWRLPKWRLPKRLWTLPQCYQDLSTQSTASHFLLLEIEI